MAQGRSSSSRAERTPVKGSAGRSAGLARHLEGWQPAAFAVFLAGATALVAVPRPVDPVDLPEPRVDMRALAASAREDAALAEGADRARLDVDVLALGSALFDYGEADASGDALALGRARARVLDASARAQRPSAPESEAILALRALRAHHLRSFLQEIRRWEATGEETQRFAQLAGGFSRVVRRSGWAEGLGGEAAPARPRLRMDQAVLAAFFKKHWNDVTGLQGAPFALTLDEERVFYRFLLRHPTGAQAGWPSALGAPSAEVARVIEGQYRLRRLDELAALDPSFPVHLARGVVLYQLRRYPLAVEAFRQHLDASPEGPWTLRAQNYLRAALGRAQEE